MKKTAGILLVVFALLSTTSCSQKKADKDKVAEAQRCLDTATASEALGCMDYVDGVSTAAADLIRCAAYMQAYNIGDASTIASVVDSVTKSGSSSNTSALLPLLAFSGGSAFSDSAKMFSYCLNSGSKGLLFLAAFSRIATAGVYAASNCGGNNATYSTACSANTTCTQMLCSAYNPNTSTAMGDAMIATNNVICAPDPTKSICTDITYAVNNSPFPGNSAAVFCTYVAKVGNLSYAVVKATTGTCP